jgi:hypothetical protein
VDFHDGLVALTRRFIVAGLLAAGCSPTPPSNDGNGPVGDATSEDATAAASSDAPAVLGPDADISDATAIDGTAPDRPGAGDASSGDAVPPDLGIAETADASGRGVVDSGLGPACHTSSQCPAGSYCLGALGSSCTMGCPATQCMDNSQCEAGVCRTVHPTATCAVGPGFLYCVPPCQTQDDCPIESTCYQGTCEISACPFGMGCPAYAQCVGADNIGLCSSKSCTTDGDCPQGYCVNGLCQHVLGSCAPSCD